MFFLNIIVSSFPCFFLSLFIHLVVSNSLWPHELYHARLLCPPLSPGICSNSCPFSQWSYLTISFPTTPFSFCLHFPASGSFPMRQLFTLGGQSIGQEQSFQWKFRVGFLKDWLVWYPCYPRDSQESSPDHNQKREFFGPQPSSYSNSPTETWLWENPELWLYGP